MAEIEDCINQITGAVRNSFNENYSKMPHLNDLPHMEPHLLALYKEAHFVTLLNLHNVSIIMQGVLLEALVKEIIFDKEKVDFQKPFGPAIERCEQMGYLDSDEIDFLTKFKNTYRNNYQHVNIKKITGTQKVDAWAITIDSTNVTESILKGIANVKQGVAGAPQQMGYDDFRPVGYVIKQAYDKAQFLPLFIEVDKFFREMMGKYLPPSKCSM